MQWDGSALEEARAVQFTPSIPRVWHCTHIATELTR